MQVVNVQETNGLTILKDLSDNNAEQILDSVFLLKRTHWHQLIFRIKGDYILNIDYNPFIKYITLSLKKDKSWKFYSSNQNINYTDGNFWIEGPKFFLSLISHSLINFTKSFHLLAYALIYEQQFIVINRTKYQYQYA